MLENELLKVEEGAFMGDLLTNLYKGLPGIFGSEFCTIWTLPMLDKIFDLECLFQYRIFEDLIMSDLRTPIRNRTEK